MMGAGIHLLIDALSDKSLPRQAVQRFLMAMPGAIDMTPIDQLRIARTPAGWAGIQLIAESHIALHCSGKEVHVDIFSCKRFDTGTAINLSIQMLGLEQINTQILDRGWILPVEEPYRASP